MEARTDELIGSKTGQGFEAFSEVVSIEEGGEVISELGMVVIMISSHGGVFECAVHAFDLSVGPRVVGFGQTVFDAVMPAGAVKGMPAQAGGNALAVLGKIGELDAAIGKHGMDAVRNGLNQGVEELGGGLGVGPLEKSGHGKLGSAINGHEKIELSFSRGDFGDVEVEVTDGIGFELLFLEEDESLSSWGRRLMP